MMEDQLTTTANENNRPWPRFFARWIDMSGLGALPAFFLGQCLALFPSGLAALKALMAIPIASNVIAMFPWVIVETILLATWGTTPGKALLKVKITNADGSGLSFQQAFSRSLSVFVKGYGMGITYLAVCENMWWHYALTNHRKTSWDRIGGFEVKCGELGMLRKCVAGFIVGLVLICIIFAGIILK